MIVDSFHASKLVLTSFSDIAPLVNVFQHEISFPTVQNVKGFGDNIFDVLQGLVIRFQATFLKMLKKAKVAYSVFLITGT